MTDKERTPFGQRLYDARKHAKLTQHQLAKKAGISQSTLGELEWKGEGSSKTAQMAMACGVRSEWLATGAGTMVDEEKRLFPEVAKLAAEINRLPKRQRDLVLLSIGNTVTLANTVSNDDQDESSSGLPPVHRAAG